MKRYLENLLTALLGRNPYQIELNKVREEYKKTAENVEFLRKMYDKIREIEEDLEKKVAEAHKMIEEKDEVITHSYKLIETLRGHLKEKDELTARIKADYQQRIDEYNKEIDGLRKRG